LEAPAYTIDGERHKGGLSNTGQKLNLAEVKKLK